MKNHNSTFGKTIVVLLTAAPLLCSVVPFRAGAADCVPSSSGLTSWWQAEGNAADAAGTNTGTPIGGLTFTAGKVGQSFNFDGVNDHIIVPDAPALDFGSNQDFSVEAWIQPQTSTTTFDLMNIVDKRNAPDISHGLGYEIALSGGRLVCRISDSIADVGTTFGAAGPDLRDGSFHHIAVTIVRNSTAGGHYYVDGAAVLTFDPTVEPGDLSNDQPLRIGSHPTPSVFALFKGKMDEVSLYSRALTAAEVQAIYSAGSAGKCVAPAPPTIITQPAGQTVIVGGTATFAVVALGTSPLSYQWRRDGTNIGGAVNSTLTLTNVQFSDAGSYSVVVTNSLDAATSSNAVLTVNPVPPCSPPSSGLVSWWRGEGNAVDEVGGNHGTPAGNATYGAGRIGQAFVFNGNGAVVQLGNPASFQTQNFTIEAWIKRASTSTVSLNGNGNGHIFGYDIGGYGLYLDPSGHPALTKVGINNVTLGTAITDTNFHHVAVTKSGSTVMFYIDGVAYAVPAYNPGFGFTTTAAIGGIGNNYTFLGTIDDLAIYNRALTTNEVQAIYNAGSAGKCVVPIPPFITVQPTNRTVTVGTNVTFSVGAGGSVPFSYQWQFNGTNLAGATGSALTLTNVQFSQGGNYSVIVTNVAGATNSGAVLTVVFPPATVRVVGGSAQSGGSVTLPVQLVANGNENALGFSLNFSTQRLTYASIALGDGAAGGSLLLNTSQTGNGRLGIAVALATDTTFLAGTQEVVRVSFTSPVLQGSSPVVTTISFGDQPTVRQLADARAQPLAANFLNGSLTLAPSDLEGDVAPRPAGDRTNTITDWVQVGRFAARLDLAADGGEFQRADCAPRSSLGNGDLNVTDWVQAGRYAAGLDPLTAAGGPTFAGSALAATGRPNPPGTNTARKVRVADATGVQGLTVTLPVTLESQGDENALGFSVSFDPAKFTYVGMGLGSAANGAALNVNTAQVGSGKVGVVLALPTGTSFGAGTREVAKVRLVPTAAAVGSNPVGFSNSPVSCVISDPFANELTADYVPGSISVNPLPALLIARSGENVTLAWPVWAVGFNLQAADRAVAGGWANVIAPPQTNGGHLVVTVPVAGETKYFRLHHP